MLVKNRKRITIIVAAIIVSVVSGAYLAAMDPIASNSHSNSKMHKKMGEKPMMYDHKGKMGMCRMHMMMAHAMFQKKIVASSDGGAIIMIGKKLYKYDSNLNLIKETEIKIDVNEMQADMHKMMRLCPMCQAGSDEFSFDSETAQASANDSINLLLMAE